MAKKTKTKKQLNIGVLMGGPSDEHEVSLSTGNNVLINLNKEKFNPIPIKISKDNRWFLNGRLSNIANSLKACDIVFNALHGGFGEDGRAQAIMEYYGAKYTGSGITASALAMDKLRSREIFKLAGFNVPKTLKIKKGENFQARLALFVGKLTGFPVVVKPCCSGSSVGVKIVNDKDSLSKAIDCAFKFGKKVLVEEFIDGREITCGVLENLNGQEVSALPVTEIEPAKRHKFFDYEAKYKAGHSKEITPANLDKALYGKAQEIATRAHQILGCSGYSRTDMIVKENGTIFILEINTLPGLTSTSLMPQAAKAAGLTFSQLLDKIIDSSLIS